jgi:hypothetical protein
MFFLETIALGFFMFCVYILFFEKKEPSGKEYEQGNGKQNDASKNNPN